jgi:hypothetical protein
MKMKFIAILFAISLLAVSCKKKCHECHYDSNAGEVEIGEYCGDELEAIEARGFTVGDTTYEVHCHEH